MATEFASLFRQHAGRVVRLAYLLAWSGLRDAEESSEQRVLRRLPGWFDAIRYRVMH